MRTKLSLAIALLLLIGLAAPATAAPGNSPRFVEEPFVLDALFPNPCLGDDAEEMYHFDGHLLVHEFASPSGNFHHVDLGYIAAWTDSGFSMPERMVGPVVENISDNASTFAGRGLYQLRNDDNQKLRLQLKIQATVVGGEVKVDIFGLEFACLGSA